jgi:FMN phosphatase YigB (HAD superfamily)
LTLEQYAAYLDSRGAAWPVVPPVERPKARPSVTPLDGIKAVTFNVYGTLLAISTGQLLFEHPTKFIMDLALEKTVQEYKMWGSMSRKPGQPSEYMGQLYSKSLLELRMVPTRGEKHPEIVAERIWEKIVKMLLQKDYQFDAGFFGSLNEYSRKIAFFFHASLQGTACYDSAAGLLKRLHDREITVGLIADAQSFTLVQLQRGLAAQDAAARVDDWVAKDLRILSFEVGAKKPSERLFKQALTAIEEKGLKPHQVLHVGSSIAHDIMPAKKLGLHTALFAGDKASLAATAEQLKDPATRPDALMTKLAQVVDVAGVSD